VLLDALDSLELLLEELLPENGVDVELLLKVVVDWLLVDWLLADDVLAATVLVLLLLDVTPTDEVLAELVL